MGCCHSQTQLAQRHAQDRIEEIAKIEEDCFDEVIIAGESLYKVKPEQLSQNLHRTIVAMKVPKMNSVNTVFGSGVLLSRNIVLTAAHNIYFKQMVMGKIRGQQLNKTKCRIYVQGNGSKFYEVEKWAYLQDFTNSKKQKIQFDYALIKLKERVNIQQSVFLQVALPCLCIQKKEPFLQLNIYGYPRIERNYQPIDKQGSIGLCQFGLTKKDSIFQVQPQLQIKYLLSTIQGQSGCPVVVSNKIIAIHKGGIPNQYNFGRLISNDLISNIEKWCQQLKGDTFTVDRNKLCPNCYPKEEKKVEKEDGKFIRLRRHAAQYESQFNYSKALDIYYELLSYQVKGTIQAARVLNNIGQMYLQEFQQQQAIKNLNRALQIYERIKGKGFLESAKVLNNLGKAHLKLFMYTQGFEYLTTALQIKQKVIGIDCLQSADTISVMGQIYYAQINYAKALQCYQRAITIFQNFKGKGCYQSGKIFNNIGIIYEDQLNFSLALQYYNYSLKIFQRSKGKGCFQSANTLNNIGILYNHQLVLIMALQYYTLALEIYQRVKGEGCFQSAKTLKNIGLVYDNRQDYNTALQYYMKTVKIYQKVKGKGCYQSANTLFNIGLVYTNQLKYTLALIYYKSALEIYQRTKGKGCFQSVNTLQNMGSVYYNEKENLLAIQYFTLALAIYHKAKGIGCQQSANILHNLGLTFSQLNRYKEAAESFQSALYIYQGAQRKADAKSCAILLAKCFQKINKHAKKVSIQAKYNNSISNKLILEKTLPD